MRAFRLRPPPHPSLPHTYNIIDIVNDTIYDSCMNDSTPLVKRLRHTGGEAHLLREIVRTHQVLMNGFSRAVGMTASRLALMRLLALAPAEGVGTMKCARQLGIDASAVTRLVKEIEAERLVVCRADAEDRRRKYIKLSAKGVRTFEEIHQRVHELERSLASVVKANEVTVAVRVLASLRNFIEGLN